MPTKNRRSLESRGKSTNYITTGGAGYVPDSYSNNIVNGVKTAAKEVVDKAANKIRKKLYDGIYPVGYNNIFNRVSKALAGEKNVKDGDLSYGDDLFAEYLQIPKEDRHNVKTLIVEDSPYRPTKGDNPNIKYKRVKLPEETKDFLIKGTEAFNIGQSGTNSELWDPYSNISKSSKSITQRYTNESSPLSDAFRLYNVGRGYDEKGEYRSIADVYDLNPWDTNNNYAFGDKSSILSFFLGNKDDVSFGIGKPVHLYDRIYLDDYYGISEPTHSTYLPEVTIYGNRKKHKDGGSIHIAPSKRGTFTAAASKHGMGVQEFASRVLSNKEDYSPSLVKKANFARNASKWNK